MLSVHLSIICGADTVAHRSLINLTLSFVSVPVITTAMHSVYEVHSLSTELHLLKASFRMNLNGEIVFKHF